MPRNLQLILVGLVALALGGALGWGLKPESSRATPIAPVAADAHRTGNTPHERASAPEPQHEQAPAREQSIQPESGQPSPPKATGSFAGIVRYSDGRPCANLPLVAYRPLPGEFEVDRIKRMSPEERRAFHEAAAKQAANTVTASTGEDGSFQIGGIGEGMHWLQCADRNVRLARATWFTEVPFEAGDYLELIALPILHMTLALTMDTGDAVASAGVRLVHLDSKDERSFWWRPDNRECEVAAGTWKVSAWAGPNRLWAGERELIVPEGGLKEPVHIELKGEDALVVRARAPRPFYHPMRVRVLAADKVPAAGVTRDIEVINLGAAEAVDPNWTSLPLRGLAPGRYVAFCCVYGSFLHAQTEFEYAGGRQWFDFEIPAPRREDHLVVRALDPSGGPLLGAEIKLGMEGAPGSVEALRQKDGEYWLRKLAPKDLYYLRPITATEYRVAASHPRFGQRFVSCSLAETEIELRFGERVTLTVKLENLPADRSDFRLAVWPAGADAEGAMLATPRRGQGPPPEERSEFHVQPGRVVVALFLRTGGGSVWELWPVVRTEIDLTTDQEYALAVPAMSSLRVHIPGTARVSVSIRGEQGQLRSASTVEERVEFNHLAAGTYTVGTEQGVMVVRVPHGGELTFEPRPYNRLVLWQFDTGGILAQAGVRLGDRIRAINGRPLEGTPQELRAAFTGAGAQGDVTLTVERAGQMLTLNIASAQWRGLQNAGTTATREE